MVTAAPARLPSAPTPLLGRDAEVAQLCAFLLDPEIRLLTLTGPPGVGKTRLALAATAQLAPGFVDGARFVEVAPVTDHTLIPSRVADALDLREIGQRSPVERLHQYLGGKQLLLTLDNFEQVLDAAPFVAELLVACPSLKILVTSRAPLHLRAEREFPLAPLALPNLTRLPALPALAEVAAVALFVARVQAVRPDFALTTANAHTVAQICHHLDGLPLALELAAARSKLFPPDALVARLSDRLALLTGGPRDLPPRQQTLRSAIAWSYDLLDPREQRLFRRLSVFAGGFTLDAARAVCAEEDDTEASFIDRLTSLVDKSLLRQEEPAGILRLRLLELLREFASEALARDGETDLLRRRHAGYFLEFAEEADLGIKGPAQRTWLATLEREHDNLRAALGWAVERGEAEIALGLTSALAWFWLSRSWLAEGRRWIETALSLPNMTGPTRVRAMSLYYASFLAGRQSDYAAMSPRIGESMAVAQALGDTRAIAHAHTGLMLLAWINGDAANVQSHIADGLTLFESTDDHWGRAWHLIGAGIAAMERGDTGAAQDRLTESIELFDRLGDAWTSAVPLYYLGWVVLREGDIARSRSLFERSLALRRDGANASDIPYGLHSLVVIARLQGDAGRVLELCRECLPLCRDIGWFQGIAWCLSELASVLLSIGQPRQAARAFAAAEGLVDASAVPLASDDRIDYRAAIAAVRDELDEATLAAMWRDGKSAPIDVVIADTLAALAGAQEATHPSANRTVAANLTPREIQVLGLLAAGFSNREIADALVVSARTVERHVDNLYGKIGARGRSNARRYAREHGLVAAILPPNA